jgi:RimJ/RimL family protein N-acetyltransferase
MLEGGMNATQPTDPIPTARLVLTPVEAEDIDDLALLYGDPMVAFWTGPWTRACIEAWATEMVKRWSADGVGKWIAHDRFNGSLVGRGGFTRVELDGQAALELGWVVRDALTGRGFATEIGRAAIGWAAAFFPHLPIVSFTEVHNVPSQAVMRRLGLREVGVIYRSGLAAGRPGMHHDAPFALYRND